MHSIKWNILKLTVLEIRELWWIENSKCSICNQVHFQSAKYLATYLLKRKNLKINSKLVIIDHPFLRFIAYCYNLAPSLPQYLTCCHLPVLIYLAWSSDMTRVIVGVTVNKVSNFLTSHLTRLSLWELPPIPITSYPKPRYRYDIQRPPTT